MTFLLHAGEALYVPFGHVVVTMAVVLSRHSKGKKPSKEAMEASVAYVVQYGFGAADFQASSTLQNKVSAWWTANRGFFRSVLKNSDMDGYVNKLAEAKDE